VIVTNVLLLSNKHTRLMKVFKFGGASVKDANAVINVAGILAKYPNDNLCVVFSAMGKTTNALEKVADAWMNNESAATGLVDLVEEFHIDIAKEINIDTSVVTALTGKLRDVVHTTPPADYDEGYDFVVSFGELISTALISSFLISRNFTHTLADARDLIITDELHRNANINWEETKNRVVVELLKSNDKPVDRVIITQGFIGRSLKGKPVTLGREGSDFSAAIFAWSLHASQVIIWKDVPGVFNANPKHFEHTVKLSSMTYRDAIELAYYGASVIHPKTIQPLQSSEIPLYVKSFYHPDEPGTVIHSHEEESEIKIPCFIHKPNQVLISISPKDFSFIAEGNLQSIFGNLSSLDLHFNMMQHSAISFSIVMDDQPAKIQRLFDALGSEYRIRYNNDLLLITIRYYDQETIDKAVGDRTVLLEQKSRTTVQLVIN